MILQKLKRYERSGFTLVELMVVVTIIAILATLSAPTLRRSVRRARVRDAASEVASVFRNARTQAMSRGEVVLVQIQPGNDAQMISMHAAPNATPGDPNTPIVRSCRLINDFAAAIANPHDGIQPQIFSKTGQGDDRQGLMHPDVQMLLPNNAILCFAPDGRVFGADRRPVTQDVNGDCRKGFVVPLALDNIPNPASYTSIVLGGNYNLICGQQIGGDTLTAAASETARKEEAKAQVARSETNFHLVEVTYNGAVNVEN